MDIRLFGNFEVWNLGKCMDEDTLRSPMLTKLMTYILCQHGRAVPVQELVDAFWPEDASDNPVGALKNLIYRLRNTMRKIWGEDQQFILTGKGSYCWNEEIALEIDTERFENLARAAAAEEDTDGKIKKYKEALALYRGMFLTKFHDVYWVASRATYYHSLYLTIVKDLSALLESEGRFEEIEEICVAALERESLDEELHSWFIKALLRQNKMSLALEQYQRAVDLLCENLGIDVPKELKTLYDEMMRQDQNKKASLEFIKKELEEEKGDGAFLCEYSTFRHMYHLEVRRAKRLRNPVFILLITVVSPAEEEDEKYQMSSGGAMERLQGILLRLLRSGDVVTRYSKDQYIILLPACQYESAKKVEARVERAFYGGGGRTDVRLHYSLGEIT